MVESLLINAVYLFTMFKTIIVEDNEEHVLGIQKIVTNNCSQLELVGVANDIDSAYDLIVDKKPNLVLFRLRRRARQAGKPAHHECPDAE